MTTTLYLASQSPRRRELLHQIGVHHKAISPDVDETPRRDEAPAEYVIRMALEKARAGRILTASQADVPVLAADTAVVVDRDILGKPSDRSEGLHMLSRLSGRSHKVLTAVAVIGRERATRLSVSEVTFRNISATESEAYWDSGEPADKAGGYAIQGLGALFVSRLEGSYSGVMGLPLFETAQLLHETGLDPLIGAC